MVFILQDDNSLVAMNKAEFASEEDFQRLLARFPELLVGDRIDPVNPRRWLLIRREQPVATGENGAAQWSLDHLFLDQDGIPTLVEVKRHTNSEIRRAVVGQMLDYAANCASFWSIDRLQIAFERTCSESARTGEDVLHDFLESGNSIESYWEMVKTNLQAGRIRLVFVADVIPLELRRIVEFLNRQMDPAHVLALELRQYAGKSLRTIIPAVFGQELPPIPPPDPSPERFFELLDRNCGEKERLLARKIVEVMRADGRPLKFGKENGSVWPLLSVSGKPINPLYLNAGGNIVVQFGDLIKKPIFDDIEARRELMARLNQISGVSLSDNQLDTFAYVKLKDIVKDSEGEKKTKNILRWLYEVIRNGSLS